MLHTISAVSKCGYKSVSHHNCVTPKNLRQKRFKTVLKWHGLCHAKRSLMCMAAPVLLLVWRLFRKKFNFFSFSFSFFFLQKSVSYQKKGRRAPLLLLVWQRLRTLGTFSRDLNHMIKNPPEYLHRFHSGNLRRPYQESESYDLWYWIATMITIITAYNRLDTHWTHIICVSSVWVPCVTDFIQKSPDVHVQGTNHTIRDTGELQKY